MSKSRKRRVIPKRRPTPEAEAAAALAVIPREAAPPPLPYMRLDLTCGSCHRLLYSFGSTYVVERWGEVFAAAKCVVDAHALYCAVAGPNARPLVHATDETPQHLVS